MNSFGCVNNTILLRSGRYFDLASPKATDIDLQDIAGALSKICRFGGHVPRFYSVAEHCCHCYDAAIADGLGRDVARLALLHDAAEAFTGDIVKPLKMMLAEFSLIESSVESAVNDAFGLEWTVDSSREVKRIDKEMLIAERLSIFGNDGVEWTGQSQVRLREVNVEFWVPGQAEAQFLARAVLCGLGEKIDG